MKAIRPEILRKIPKVFVVSMVMIHTGLVALYFLCHALWQNQIWIIDALGYILPFLFAPSLFLLPITLMTRSRPAIVAAAIPPVLFALTYGQLFLPKASPGDATASFRVMTYNVLDTNEQYENVARQIEVYDPDLLGLHELEPDMARFLESRFESRYPYIKTAPGRGLFSRYPLENYEVFRLNGDGHWAQQATVIIDGRELALLNVHVRSPRLQYGRLLGLPSDFDTEKRDADMADIVRRVAGSAEPLVLMGDFNLSDRQEQYAQLTVELMDAYRERGWGLGFTRTNYPSSGLPTWRIDYVFYSPGLAALRAEVGDYAGSDHKPVVVDLGF